MERKKNEELLKQIRKMPSRELMLERKRNEELLKQLHETKSKLKAFQNVDTPSKSTFDLAGAQAILNQLFFASTENRKSERSSPTTTDRKLRSSTHKVLRSGKCSKKSNIPSIRDQNLNSYGNVHFLR